MTEDLSVAYDPWLPFDQEREPANRAAIRELQSKCPVAHRPDGAWIVTSTSGAREVLERIEDFGGTFGNYAHLDREEVILPGLAEPQHSIVRRGVNASVAYHRSVTVIPYLRDLTQRLLADALETCRTNGSVDLYSAVLRDIPSAVIAHLLGVPEEDRAFFTRWGDELCELQMEGDNFNKSFAELHPEFAEYVEAHVAQRRSMTEEGQDSISRMIRVAESMDADPMSDRMIRTQLMFLLVAGNETTRNLLGSLFYRIATDPAHAKQLQAEPALVENAVEETLRIEPPVRFVVRRCPRPTALDGEEIQPDEPVLVSIEAANRDAATFEHPDDFDLQRDRPRDHVSFGSGAHICPGAFLARLEGRVVVETFLEVIEDVRLVDGAGYVANPISWARGPVELPVVLTPHMQSRGE
jgi:cytochrome P450